MRPKIPKIEALRPSAGWLRRCSGQGTHVQALSGPADQPAASPRELLAIIPDNPGVLMHRIAIRPQHSPNFVRLHQEGYVTWAGPLFEKHVRNGTRPFKGSVMVVTEEDTRSLLSRIESDIYVREGVWNLNQARIMPFRTLLRWQNGPAKSNQDY